MKLLIFFKNHNYPKLHKIIRTESNGKPGKGYNSLFKFFKTHNKYDYLITMDGDDFLYPEALYRINIIIDKYSPDIINLAGNTWITNENITFDKETDTSFKFSCNYNFEEFRVTNFSKDYNNILATPSRAILISRKVTQFYNTIHVDDMNSYSDYKIFLISYKEYYNNRLNVVFLSDPYIYLWNNTNSNSNSKCADTLDFAYDKQVVADIKNNLNITDLKIEDIPIILNDTIIEKKIIDDFYLKIIKNMLSIKNFN